MRLRTVVVTAFAAAALLGGCAANEGDGGDKVASVNQGQKPGGEQAAAPDGKSDEDKMREYARCMREHGVDMPDPQPGTNGMQQSIEIKKGEEEKMRAAGEACRKLLPNGGEIKPPTPEELDKMRREAQCMREQGIDMPDPDPGNPGMRMGIDASDPKKFEAAAEKCGLGMSIGAARAEGK
ncbi:hypothetical protein [Amycolatopsis suaedae]|uniref:Uncharacterized protein n=1 Tax=Amycolatopsis suaedae TaxID=2510978 RepID=A0A4Q7J6B2_9PSEU|nr:hypothetical protein [Amycolatopsis suaedae]RZQ61843.1 hypothetical protein EWH70_23150 [Amycolatopsis suaedae]